MSYAYPKDLLDNTHLIDEAEQLRTSGFMEKEQLSKLKAEVPALHSQHNILMRIAMFLFGCFLLSSCYGFITVLIGQLSNYSEGTWRVIILLDAGLAFWALEIVIRTRRFFRFGIDDAFLFTGIIMLLGFTATLNNFDDLIGIYIVAILAGAFCGYRYIDSLATLIACIGTTALVADICVQAGVIGQSILPFVLMANAGLLYYVYIRLKKIENAVVTWGYCLKAIEGYSVILFYLAGNYMIVREGTVLLLNQDIPEGGDIPFAWFFYAFTILIPVVYIYLGLKNRNRMLLQIGMLAFVFGVYAIRYYHQILPIEWGLIIAGVVAFTIAYFSIVKLRGKTSGIIFKPGRFTNRENILDAEAVAIAQNFGAEPAKQNNQTEFGGGEFGGGGGGGNF